MRRLIYILPLLLISFMTNIYGQVFHDASNFLLLGKISEDTETLYERLPMSLKDKTRPPVWHLGKNTAGLAIRFSSNTSSIVLEWTPSSNYSMDHMTDVAVKGLDLYAWDKGKWVYVNSARPQGKDSRFRYEVISNMSAVSREYMLYLPLYDGLKNLNIGVDSLAEIGVPQEELICRNKPIVAYGTSILQGGCASRPGMSHINILGRWLNKEIVNMGFSGNGQLDYEIAEIMSEKDASVYVLDFMPNVNVEQINEKMETFYRIIRSKSKDVPILFIENPIFPHSKFDCKMKETIEEKNKALRKVFEVLNRTDENICLLPASAIIGVDNEATVDGIHFTDLGFMRYAEYLFPVLKNIIEIGKIKNKE